MPRKFHCIEDYADLGQAVIVQLVNLFEDATALHDELRQCVAVAFFDAVKVAGLLSYQRGHGFVISRQGDEKQWGPPVFMEMNLAGVGFSFGWQNFQTLMIIPTEEHLEELVSSNFQMQTEMALDMYITGSFTAQARRPRLANKIQDVKVYHVSQGSIVDLSLVGGVIAPSVPAMNKYYGKNMDPMKVLKGVDVTPPKDMRELYELLDSAAK